MKNDLKYATCRPRMSSLSRYRRSAWIRFLCRSSHFSRRERFVLIFAVFAIYISMILMEVIL
jgi:hypothetical protein